MTEYIGKPPVHLYVVRSSKEFVISSLSVRGINAFKHRITFGMGNEYSRGYSWDAQEKRVI